MLSEHSRWVQALLVLFLEWEHLLGQSLQDPAVAQVDCSLKLVPLQLPWPFGTREHRQTSGRDLGFPHFRSRPSNFRSWQILPASFQMP
jgi:hypothetical protein